MPLSNADIDRIMARVVWVERKPILATISAIESLGGMVTMPEPTYTITETQRQAILRLPTALVAGERVSMPEVESVREMLRDLTPNTLTEGKA